MLTGATEVTGLLEEADVGDALLEQANSNQLSAVSTANDDDLILLIDRVASEAGINPGVLEGTVSAQAEDGEGMKLTSR